MYTEGIENVMLCRVTDGILRLSIISSKIYGSVNPVPDDFFDEPFNFSAKSWSSEVQSVILEFRQ